MGFLSPDSKFMRIWNSLADGVWLNILMVVTSLPLVTIGAALTAGHETARRSLGAEGHLTCAYFRSFADNIVRSTLLWIPFGIVLAGLAYSWLALPIPILTVPKIVFTILWFVGFEWVFALQARFDNTYGRTLVNSFVFGVSNILHTVMLIGIDAVYMVLLGASWLYLPQGVFLLFVLGYGCLLMLHTPVLEHVFRRYIEPENGEEAEA